MIKIGMFGHFWTDDGDSENWGELFDVEDDLYVCKHEDDFLYDNFIPGLPEGFNQDGTPK